jgi:MFS family permease
VSPAPSSTPETSPTPLPPAQRRRDSTLRRNIALCTGEGLVAMPIVFLTLPGNFIVAMLLSQTFRLGETTFGLIVSLPYWCNVVQLFVVPFLTKRWSQKAITLTLSWLHLSVWIAIALMLPLIPNDDVDRAGRMLFWLFGLSALSSSVVGVSWTSWVQEWVPDRLRGKYFGRRNRLLQLSTVVFLLGAGEALTQFNLIAPVLGFQLVIGVSVALRMFSILAQSRILTTTTSRTREAGLDFRTQVALILRNRPLLWLYAFGASFGLLANIFGPFFNVFLYDSIGMSVAQVSMLTVIFNVTGAIALPAWGQFMDRYGNRPGMNVALVAWMLPGFLWAFLTPENSWMIKFVFASGGIFSAGYLLGSFNLLLKLVPPEAKTAAISINVAVTSLAAAMAPILGGMILDHLWSRGVDKLDGYHAMAIAHHILVLLSGLVLLKVVEPKASPLTQVVGAMRSYRQVFALLGMSFLLDYVFTKNRRD